MTEPKEVWISVKEAAAMVGIHPSTFARFWIPLGAPPLVEYRDNGLPGQRRRSVQVNLQDLERVLEERTCRRPR